MSCPPWTPPSVADFMAFFNREFPYPPAGILPNPNDYVQPADITKAISMALVNFNSGLFGSFSQITTVFLYLAAFYLTENLKIAQKGIAAQVNFPTVSAGVGGVNQSFQVPDKVTKSPFLFQYTANAFGMVYLSFALPQTVGNVGIVTSGVRAWGNAIGFVPINEVY